MKDQKLYALRTTDTGEWVSRFGNKALQVYPTPHAEFLTMATRLSDHPCEWVEVHVLTDEQLEAEKKFKAWEAWKVGKIGSEEDWEFERKLFNNWWKGEGQ